MTVHVLTGATGFVGGAIALELLDEGTNEIVGIVRETEPGQATTRLRTALIGMAEGYARPDLIGAINDRVRAVPGDITAPQCGVVKADIKTADVFWHAAASLNYEEKHRASIELHNVTGTRNTIDLVRKLDVSQFHHISTAYVAGRQRGPVVEGPAEHPEWANNAYEATKIQGEKMVAAESADRTVRIMRPGIVIGHSETRHGVNYSGMYGFAKTLLKFKHQSAKTLGTFLSHARLRLMAEPEIAANVVPIDMIDMVARNAVRIWQANSPHTYYHLVNSTPPTVGDGVKTLMLMLGFREPLWVTDDSGFTSIDRMLNAGMDFYGSYLLNGKQFSTANTEDAAGAGSCAYPIDGELLTDFFRYYLQTHPAFETVTTGPARQVHASL